MSRKQPFDSVCSCEYETETHYCLCTRKKGQVKQSCQRCMDGSHQLKPKKILTSLGEDPKKKEAI